MVRVAESEIHLSRDGAKSLQMRLREAVSAGIWEGRFAPGDRLPATRALAAWLGVARITVSLAYEELVTDGWLVSAPRSGFSVAEDAPSLIRAEAAAPDPGEAIDWAARLGPAIPALGGQAKPADWRGFPYPFVFGQADLAGFPLDEWRFCARQALGRAALDTVSGDFGDRDDPMLVQEIARRSLPGRGVHAPPGEVLVTAGAQNAMWLAAMLILRASPGAVVAVEEPGYPELRRMLRLLGARVAPVAVDDQGVVPELVPADAACIVVTPSHQAPTGATMSMPRREALLALAEARDFVLIEDDYDFETSYVRPHLPALKALDRRGRVLYAGSFSKSLFPGLRLGYLCAPTALIERARAARTLSARHPPGLTQRAAAHFLALGHYNAHAKAIRARLGRRRRLLAEALEANGVAAPPGNRFGGASLWLEGPATLDAERLAEALRGRGVLIEPGRPFFAARDAPRNFMRLGFSAIPDERIAPGVALIVEEMARQAGEGAAR